jgi:hypothetical protein
MRLKISLLAVLAGAALALLAVLLLRFGGLATPPQNAAASYAADALADYLPADAAAVISLDLRGLRAAAVARGRLGEELRRLVYHSDVELPWLRLARVDPWKECDRVRVVLPAGEPTHPLWLVHGHIDPDRFEVGPAGLVPQSDGGRRLYEYRDPVLGPTWLATAGDTLVVSLGRARLLEALRHASEPHPTAVHDSTLRELLAKVDRTQALWLAASLEALGPMRMQNRALNAMLGPVLRRARGIQGGVRAGEDLGAELTLDTANEAAAEQLEGVLKNVVTVAQGAALLPGADPDLAPLFQLLGTGEATRAGAVVTLRCKLTAEMLGP